MDLETIAAYIEGRLPPERMAEVAAHLARSPDDYQVYSDAVALRAELLQNPEGAGVPSPKAGFGRWPHRWLYLGAASAAAVAALLLVSRAIQPGASQPLFLSAEELSVSGGPGSLDTRLGEGWASPPWSRMRGTGDGAMVGPSAFRAGAISAHLLLAADANDGTAIRDAARDLDASPSIAAADPIVARIVEIATSTDNDGVDESLKSAVTSLRDVYQHDWFDLGVWTEQARLSALAGETAFFRNRGKQDELRSLHRRLSEEPAAATVVTHIDSILTALGDSAGALDLEAIRSLLDRVFEASA